MKITNPVLEKFGLALDQESWEWLIDFTPTIAGMVRECVGSGLSPDDIRSFVLKRCGTHRSEFAQRCQAAARYLKSTEVTT